MDISTGLIKVVEMATSLLVEQSAK